MRTLLLVTIFILSSSTAQVIPYQYSNTIDVSGYAIEGFSSDGSNLLAILGDWPVDKIGTFDVSGNLINSFNVLGAFTASLAYNGNQYEMNPLNGAVSDPLGFSGNVQPYLAFDGSNILASCASYGNA